MFELNSVSVVLLVILSIPNRCSAHHSVVKVLRREIASSTFEMSWVCDYIPLRRPLLFAHAMMKSVKNFNPNTEIFLFDIFNLL